MNKSMEFLKQQVGKDSQASPSPLMRWLNPTLLSAEEGKLKLQYVVRNEMTNPIGILHGGTTAAIIDDAIGATIFSLGEAFYYVTVNLVVDYFNKVRQDEVIIAETQLVKRGQQIINVQCEVWNEDKSKLIARGYSNLTRTDIEK